MTKPIEYYLDSMDSWQKDFFGATRIRGLIVYSVGGIIIPTILVSTGEPWWWKNYSSGSVEISYSEFVIGFSVVLLLLVFFALAYLRIKGVVSSKVDNQIHSIAHYCRDSCLFRKQDKNVVLISERLCELSQKLFRILLKGDVRNYFRHNLNVNVVIRLASSVNQNEISYSTVGRSSGLNQNRSLSSKPLELDEGIIKLINNNGNQGVVLLNNLEKAEKDNIYKRSKNDKIYQKEVRSKAIAPINGWDGEKRSMIGVLVITSSHCNTIKHKHVDLIATVADIYANLYSVLISSRVSIPLIYTANNGRRKEERRKEERRKEIAQIRFRGEKRLGQERRCLNFQ